MTQISNRRNFILKAEAYFERHKKNQKPIALLFADIDRFKQINDTYGHLAGDEILKKVANIISDSIRPMDLCSRYGGEEFVICLYEADESQAVIVITSYSIHYTKLYDHIITHFNYEEKSLSEVGYEDIQNHQKIHGHLLKRAQEIKERNNFV